MDAISHSEVMSLLGCWERENKKIAVLGSNADCSISIRSGHVTICLDDLLQLSFAEDGILRLFLRGASYWPADPKDFSPELRTWYAGFEKGVQLRFANPEMQYILLPSGRNQARR
jgi:hypothetical protein